MRTLIREDSSLSCWEIAAIMDCSKSMLENIIKKIGMRCVVLTWVLHYLTKLQLQKCVGVYTCLKNKYWDDQSFMSHVVTWDEVGSIITTIKQSKKEQLRRYCNCHCKWRSVRLNQSLKGCSSFLLTNVESFIDIWSHPLIKNKNESSIPSIIVRFWKLRSHTSLKKKLFIHFFPF